MGSPYKCFGLTEVRYQQMAMLDNSNKISEQAKQIIDKSLKFECTISMQLLLDCSVLEDVRLIAQTNPNILSDIFKFTRTWCFNVHMKRLKLQGRWNK